MSEIAAIAPVGISSRALASEVAPPLADPAINKSQGLSFAELLSRGADQVELKIAEADRMVRNFAVDETIPVHQVTIALEEARYSVEFAMQVRQRLVEAYRDLMNMQL